MKKLLLTVAVMLLFGVSVRSQDACPSGMVCVPQATANQLFNTVEQLIEAKDVIAKMLKERGASDATINSALQVIEGWKNLDAINNTIILKQKDVIALYEKVIGMYERVVDNLEKRLAKPKSPFGKFMDALKTLTYFLAGAALGRGL